METFDPSNDDIPATEWRLAERQAREALRNQRNNERFAKASPAQKRVILAKDVLKWLAIGKLVPAGRDASEGEGASEYLRIIDPGSPGHRWSPSVPMEDVRAAGKVNGYACTACAIGGLIAAAAERDACSLFSDGRDFIPTRDNASSEIRAEMGRHDLFSNEQLKLVEQAYEVGVGISIPHDVAAENVEAARAFGLRFSRRHDRLTAIMKNIIANKGTFTP